LPNWQKLLIEERAGKNLEEEPSVRSMSDPILSREK